MFDGLRQMLEMVRFSHTVFALPFALLAAVMAVATPVDGGRKLPFNPWHWIGILVCMVSARSAAMAFNRLADRNIDAQNPRTKNRHLPMGTLSVGNVSWFTVASSAIFVAATFLFVPNYLPPVLSGPVLGFLFAYSYTKRFFWGAHFWLGAALMLAPVCAWLALRGQFVMERPADLMPAIILGFAVLLWVSGFDIIYACQDYHYDVAAKLKSVPARWGVGGALRLAAGCHLSMLLVLGLLPWFCPNLALGWIYGTGLAAVAILLVYEHALVRPDDLSRVNVAFFHVNSVVSLGLFVVTTIDILT